MISEALSQWIAQSESWQTFVDFDMPNRDVLDYTFLRRSDDFYISLFGNLYDLLEDDNRSKQDMLAVAKGLEIFSLKNKKDNFFGVDQLSNILFAASLYYLSDFSSSAYILANLFKVENYHQTVDQFILEFLQRKLSKENLYSNALIDFLNTGNNAFLDTLLEQIIIAKNNAFLDNPSIFSLYLLAESILKKFKTDNIWADLLIFNNSGHWAAYVEKSVAKSFPVWSFFPSQKLALEKGILNNFNSVALQTPTSSGKTAICELIIYNEVKNNQNCKILYLAPFRALASELRGSFGRNLYNLGISSRTMYGGDMPTAAQKQLIQNVSLLISTPEKFIALENSIKDFLNDFTIIICDEGHLLDDGNRGLHYELLLSRLKSRTEINRKFVFISALIPNIEQINRWLGGTDETVVRSNYRATELEYGFLKEMPGNNGNYLLDVNPFKNAPQKYTIENFLTKNDFQYPGKRKVLTYSYSSTTSRCVAIALKSLNLGSVALFTPTKGGDMGVSGLANQMLKQIALGLNLPKPTDFLKPDSTFLNDLREYCVTIFGENYTLCKLLNIGAVYHHGDLPQYVREVIEDGIRTEEIKLVICTNTLAEGVNLPIRTIVIYSTKRYDPETKRPKHIDLRDLKNLVGRAGRAGKETKGLIIVANPDDFNVMENIIKDRNIDEVYGHLFSVIKQLTEIIIERRLVLTNEILEVQNENFKQLIDIIDISLIDLLSEEIEADALTVTIQSLIDQTFAKFQSNQEQSEVLTNIINLRGDRLRPYVVNSEFKYIKQSGSNLRLYIEINEIFDLNNAAWAELENPTNDSWLDFIIDENIARLNTLKYQLSEFNRINKTAINFNQVKEIIKAWINGAWFQSLSIYFNNDVDVTLRFINSLICYHIQSASSVIIRNLQLRISVPEFIPEHIVNFPTYLSHGLKSKLQLNLLELGFNDRIGIIELADLLEIIIDDEIVRLNEFLINSREQLLNTLERVVPRIVYQKLVQSFNMLSRL